MKTRKSSRQSSGSFKHLLASVIFAGLFFLLSELICTLSDGAQMFADKLDVRANNTILYLANHPLSVAFSMAQAKLCTGCLEVELVDLHPTTTFTSRK
jgi:hypothetical protein